MYKPARESAITPIIAEILVVALVCLAAVIAYVFIFQLPSIEKIPMVAADITKNGSQVSLLFLNGDPLEQGRFYVTVNGDRVSNGNISLVGGSYPWSPGERLVLNYSGTSAIRDVKLVYLGKPTTVMLASALFPAPSGNSTPVNNTPIYSRYPGFTVEAWVKWNNPPNSGGNVSRQWATIVIDGNSDSNRRYQLQHSSTNSYFEFARQKNSGGMAYIESTTSPSTGVLYQVVGVYNQTPGTMSIYVNGVQEYGANTGGVDSSGLRPSPNIYQIGGPSGITFNGNAHQRIFDGEIKGLNTYEWAMSPAEITANFAKGVVPVASFIGTPASGTVPLLVSFADNSTNFPTSWLWNFGDGSGSSTRNPAHTYNSTGTYTVSLKATNADGSDTKIISDYISVISLALPVANFTGSPTSGSVPLIVSFVDDSANFPTSWLWNFGDGSGSSARNPSHTYNAIGTYTVSLNATNAGGSNTKTQTGYITGTALPGFTVESWVKWNAAPNPGGNFSRQWATIVVDGNSDSNRRYQLQHNSDNSHFEFAMVTVTSGGSGTWVTSSTTPAIGTWYYVTGVYDQTPGTMAIYVNGVSESLKNFDSSGLRDSPAKYQLGGPLGITFNGITHQRIFEGDIRGLNTYERAMSPAEITANFAKGVPP